jgi:hypothetical protein
MRLRHFDLKLKKVKNASLHGLESEAFWKQRMGRGFM